MSRRRSSFALGLAVVLAAALATTVTATTSKAAYSYHIGDALLQSLGFPVGVLARADNGDTVKLVGTGTFDASAKTAGGGGTFIHKNASGVTLATGTWTATGLVAFAFYGCIEGGLCGGRATLNIVATPDAAPSVHLPALLGISCVLGSPPASATEGITVNVQDLINFNKHVEEGGNTLFLPE